MGMTTNVLGRMQLGSKNWRKATNAVQKTCEKARKVRNFSGYRIK